MRVPNYNISLVINVQLLKFNLLFKGPGVRSSSVQNLFVQSCKCPASKHPVGQNLTIESSNIKNPSLQACRVQASRLQLSRRPESKRLNVQSPSVEASRVQAYRPCVESPAFAACLLEGEIQAENFKFEKPLLCINYPAQNVQPIQQYIAK